MRSRILRVWLLLVAFWVADGAPCLAGPGEVEAPPTELGSADLSPRIERLLTRVLARPLEIGRASPWEIMHGVMAFERQASVINGITGETIDAVDFLLRHATHEGRRLFREVDGVVVLPEGSEESGWVQTHSDQLLMALADAGVDPETEVVTAEGRRIPVALLVEQSRRGLRVDQELGWTLVALSTYGRLEDFWTNDRGEEFTFIDLVERAIYRDPRMETEGGHHHLYGVAYAVDRHREAAGEADKVWRKARFYLDNFIEHAKIYQQSNGAFSAAGFRGSRSPSSLQIDLQETGHSLEWLALALPPEELQAPWVRRAVAHLCDLLDTHSLDTFPPGALYHAAHALRLYRERVAAFSGAPPKGERSASSTVSR